jgi:hypothetical protein
MSQVRVSAVASVPEPRDIAGPACTPTVHGFLSARQMDQFCLTRRGFVKPKYCTSVVHIFGPCRCTQDTVQHSCLQSPTLHIELSEQICLHLMEISAVPCRTAGMLLSLVCYFLLQCPNGHMVHYDSAGCMMDMTT